MRERVLVHHAPTVAQGERERGVAPGAEARVRALVVEVGDPPVGARGPGGGGEVDKSEGRSVCGARAGGVQAQEVGEGGEVVGGRVPYEVLGLVEALAGSGRW
jgi:hypothetical protein